MQNQTPAPAKRQCNYQSPFGWHCPFDAEHGSDLCIFHQPVEQKDPANFWQHLASYLVALLDKAGDDKTKSWQNQNPGHWVFREAKATLTSAYAARIKPEQPWRFTGFILPEMDDDHYFASFLFPACDFIGAQFSAKADFSGARFDAEADFGFARFIGPADLTQAKINGLVDFTRASLRNRLLFAGTIIGEKAAILLWDLDFVHGTSDITMEKGHEQGRIIEPAGQVVFRDISENMNRVSFLHTDIITDRLLVRFANVKWETDPKEFIFDAKFASRRTTNGILNSWPRELGCLRNRLGYYGSYSLPIRQDSPGKRLVIEPGNW